MWETCLRKVNFFRVRNVLNYECETFNRDVFCQTDTKQFRDPRILELLACNKPACMVTFYET